MTTGGIVRRCVCPGSFDPVTNGHLDVVERAAGVFDDVVVAVLVNVAKKGLFDLDERIEILRDACSHLRNVRIASFEGLLVDFARQNEISVVIRGLRAMTDFEHELSMAQMNHRLTGLETFFVATNPEYSYLSSSLVKEVASYGGDVSGLVPKQVQERLRGRFEDGRSNSR
nr:pantetheine-phosphate adenylyltransferase [Phytoactinopolyspora endophytica]